MFKRLFHRFSPQYKLESAYAKWSTKYKFDHETNRSPLRTGLHGHRKVLDLWACFPKEIWVNFNINELSRTTVEFPDNIIIFNSALARILVSIKTGQPISSGFVDELVLKTYSAIPLYHIFFHSDPLEQLRLAVNQLTEIQTLVTRTDQLTDDNYIYRTAHLHQPLVDLLSAMAIAIINRDSL